MAMQIKNSSEQYNNSNNEYLIFNITEDLLNRDCIKPHPTMAINTIKMLSFDINVCHAISVADCFQKKVMLLKKFIACVSDSDLKIIHP